MIIRKFDNKYIIKILNNELNEYDYYNQEKIVDLFKKIIIKIKEKNNIKGILDINAYTNKNYGIVLEIEEVYPYFDEIEMHIHFHIDTIFLIEINAIDMRNKKEIYFYQEKFYTVYNKKHDNNVIYKTNEILTKGIRIA